MVDILTPRIVLHPIRPAEAARIIAREPLPDDAWAPGYPFEDELDVLRPLAASPATAGAGPFATYMIRERESGLAIGGLGFVGEPDATGAVEIGYGLIPGARGHGFATEAVRGAVELARMAGATSVTADTAVDNGASQRVMQRAGFSETARDEKLVYWAILLES
ncbi:GNAT family N-acetyltransferase [Glaciihabitans sp. dw_435]|uniref:GNAT family N-acetyltransferase n=1 Tax=Glaciihabitans sp. dw_435 TaxID=2720081 RepID=UPI001BD55AA5|nr:GNAT family N-acetyltransferase [Glaciihabitans sp. dw_435]